MVWSFNKDKAEHSIYNGKNNPKVQHYQSIAMNQFLCNQSVYQECFMCLWQCFKKCFKYSKQILDARKLRCLIPTNILNESMKNKELNKSNFQRPNCIVWSQQIFVLVHSVSRIWQGILSCKTMIHLKILNLPHHNIAQFWSSFQTN